jgi:hypothetical protein
LFHEVPVLPGSSRGEGGFGSTGQAALGGLVPRRGAQGGRGGRAAPPGSGGSPGGSPPRGEQEV